MSNKEFSRSEDSKNRILLAAAEIFSHKGLDGARLMILPGLLR
ncbi:hypothetical protein N752_00725 [Desulforamulus aquiferis]|nr:hypothetical protein [Desulforamulus aquiferis]RYD07139.1 hypothetical protein N752_00725 [Desulforamulus aquiferis]